ncbi:MAG: CopD family protein [Gammaproteobacteria bacterium]|nr:CopD family protein [Gammaproteobacteria bacterium]
MTLDPIPFAVTAMDHVALALVVGTAAAWLYLLPAGHGNNGPSRAPMSVLVLALALLAFTSAADLLARTAALADVSLGAAWPYLGRALTHSDYGGFWQLRAVAWTGLLGLTLFIAWCGPVRVAAWGIAVGAVTIIFTASATGHAGDDGALALPALINALHITAACLWGGSVLIYAIRLLPALQRPGIPAQILAQTAMRLSTLAGAALAMVLATGIYNAWRLLPDWPSLWESGYGRALMLKLAAVAVMMVIGAANRFFLVPGVGRWARQNSGGGTVRLFLRVLRVDAAVFLLVLAGAALLGMQAPPGH